MKYVPSPLVGQLSGTQGSTTASHNRYGSYFRNRVIPVNPDSIRQQVIRALMTSFSQNWRALTDAQRTGWSSLSEGIPRIDVQGQTFILAGSAFYNSFNLLRNSVALARLDNAPALVEVPPSTSDLNAVVTIAGTVFELFPAIINGSATNRLLIAATPPISAGINFVKPSLYRNITVIVGNVVVASDIQAAYEAVFGTSWLTSAGMQIGFRSTGVSVSGFIGGQTLDRAVIA